MRNIVSLIVLFLFTTLAYAQNKSLGVGTAAPNPNAALHVESPTNNQGFIMPRLTTAQRTDPGFQGVLSPQLAQASACAPLFCFRLKSTSGRLRQEKCKDKQMPLIKHCL